MNFITTNCLAQTANGTGAGNCLSYNGSSNYVNAGNVVTSYSSFTFSFWIKINSFTHVYYMCPFGQGQAQYPPIPNNFHFYTSNGSGSFGFCGRWTDGSGIDARTNIPFSTGVWKHITITYDGSTVKQYVDGVLLNQVSYSSKTMGNTYSLLIGKGYAYPGTLATTYFDGQIDEFTIWNVARTETEIKDNMCKKLKGNESGLVGYWRFDEGSGSTAYDASPNGNNGTLY